MAKGIIVTTIEEIPVDCYHCTEPDAYRYCRHTGIYIDYRTKRGERYDLCPIKPMPEKIYHKSRQGLLQEQIMVGWNMCIDEILGEEIQDDNA